MFSLLVGFLPPSVVSVPVVSSVGSVMVDKSVLSAVGSADDVSGAGTESVEIEAVTGAGCLGAAGAIWGATITVSIVSAMVMVGVMPDDVLVKLAL